MKKFINLFLMFSLMLSQFSSFAMAPANIPQSKTNKTNYEKIKAAGSEVANRVRAVGDAVKNRMDLIAAGLQEGKNKLVEQIKSLGMQAKQIKEQIQAYGSRAIPAIDRKKLMENFNVLDKNIIAIAAIGPVSTIAYNVANKSTIESSFIQKAKRTLMAPIKKMVASWRSFKAKMSCLGNSSCTEQQRKEAAAAFRKVYFTIYGLVVLAAYGTIFAVALAESMQEAEASVTSYQTGINSFTSSSGYHTGNMPMRSLTTEDLLPHQSSFSSKNVGSQIPRKKSTSDYADFVNYVNPKDLLPYQSSFSAKNIDSQIPRKKSTSDYADFVNYVNPKDLLPQMPQYVEPTHLKVYSPSSNVEFMKK